MPFCRIGSSYTTFLCKPKNKTISLKIKDRPQLTLKTVLWMDFCLSFFSSADNSRKINYMPAAGAQRLLSYIFENRGKQCFCRSHLGIEDS